MDLYQSSIYCIVKGIGNYYKQSFIDQQVNFYATIEEVEKEKQSIVSEIIIYLQEHEYCINNSRDYTDSHINIEPYKISILEITKNSSGISRREIFNIEDIECPCNSCMTDIKNKDKNQTEKDKDDKDDKDDEDKDEDDKDDEDNKDNVGILKRFMVKCEKKIINYFPILHVYDNNYDELIIEPYKVKTCLNPLCVTLIFKKYDEYLDYFLYDITSIRTGDIYFKSSDNLSKACAHAFNGFFTSNYEFCLPRQRYFKVDYSFE